jgi:hypothetical protein
MLMKENFLQVAAKKSILITFIRRETVFLMAKTSAEDAVDWDDLYKQLYSFAYGLLCAKSGYRGQTDSYVGGKQVHDYVSEAIEKHLTHPEKFDASKGGLVQYLKYNLVRSLISNDGRCAENRTSSDLSVARDQEESPKNYLDALAPAVNEYFDDAIDYHTIISCTESALEGDETAKEIFLGIVSGLKRADIIQEFKMTAKQFDNGMRRLKTAQKEIARKFNLEPSKS